MSTIFASTGVHVRALAIAIVAAMSSGCHQQSAAPSAQAPDGATKAPVAAVQTPAASLTPPTPTPPATPAPSSLEPATIPTESRAPDTSAACLAKTSNPDRKPAPAIHRWVDANGLTHYSDQAPVANVSGHRILEAQGLPPIAVRASGHDVNLPSELQQRAVVDALSVQQVFRDALGIAGPLDLSLNIVFVRDPAAYTRLVGPGVLAASAGAYVPPQRTIYVRMQADGETEFAVVRHEITHALVHELIGNLPVPLNEGLAEYFRRYRAAGLGGQIDIAADKAALALAAPAGDGSDALVELLALAGPDFYAADRERRYLRAYALVATLMRDPEGTAALHEVLVRQRADPCVPVAVEAALEERYPGGLQALAADWAGFLRDPPATVRAY
jgi:hypothetical protein